MERHFTVDVAQRRTERNAACSICTERWPVRQIQAQDGIESDRRCPNHFEPNGGSLARDLDRAAASDISTAITMRFAEPPKFPFEFDPWDDVRVLDSFSPEPRRLTAGGAAAVLTITGSNLASNDTIVYGHAGITNSVAPALTPVTYDSDGNALTPFHDVLVLTVQASIAVPPGLYKLTYEDAVYYNIFDVRA